MDKLTHFQEELIAHCHYRMDESLRMLRISLSTLTEDEVWQKPNASLNSVGNLVLHLCGNMRQYGIASLTEMEDNRNRDIEFSTTGGYDKTGLLKQLETTVTEVKQVISATTVERFLQKQKVQGFEFSGIGNCIHLVEHLSYHTGQIAFWAKLLKNKQLGFYAGVDLNKKNVT
ncbi:Hypothetical protein I595_253 [Croceitalea dokdonensis DOKDO 023]|uniref:DUF1572 domain-containing protein n=1 Tax=Croceitalea dokdonensis DOKDO 023 TaxID=1300341 RepID=A0A0P7AN56_9FLAO|nr:DinB family protein [Croceitalea dokdonensis]KPM33350.1 Hypothetical protein I595_253 [Croceitalea dokdonensis DOKDO 023]